MSYVGKEPTFGSYPSQLLSGNGVLTSFTLTHGAANPAALIVSIDGVKQNVNAYGVTGTTLDFGAGNPPPSGTNNIEVIYMGLRADYVMADGTLGTDGIMRTNAQTINENITIPSTTNAVSGGPVTIGNTYTVIVNGNWSIV
jgi:hypothetical protein